METAAERVNIANAVKEMAARRPDADAVVCPAGGRGANTRYRHLTYRELDRDSDRIARGLARVGIGAGTRTVLMVKPSPDFFALTFGLFKAGAVPVIVDPGMGIGPVGRCLAEAEPEAFIGIGKAHAARVLFRWARKTLRVKVAVGSSFGGTRLQKLRELGESSREYHPAPTRGEDVAAILFTSGSTGPPKGAVYTHGNFAAQVEMLRDTYGIEPGEIDLPTFPLFALFDPALGMTTIVPKMNASRPGSVHPPNILEPVRRFGVTNLFASPALLRRVGAHGAREGVKLPTLRRVICAGAPVPAATLREFHRLLGPDAEIFTPYGATEALPVASIGSREILSDTVAKTAGGAGVCVGRVVEPNRVDVIRIDDGPIATWDDGLRVPDGEVGEIVVQGPTVTRAYHGRPEATALAKIRDGDQVRHRMGDLGYFDESGRLWFCGRKSHRVETAAGRLYSVCCEEVMNSHLTGHARRTAVVGIPTSSDVERAVLCVERGVPGPDVRWRAPGRGALAAEEKRLLALADEHERTRGIDTVLHFPSRSSLGTFPVDARHNSKIRREILAEWAAKHVR